MADENTDDTAEKQAPRGNENTHFKTMMEKHVPFGKNNFIEIARKKYVAADGEREFISISRGYFLRDNSKRFKNSITIPDDEEVIDFISQAIKEMMSDKE